MCHMTLPSGGQAGQEGSLATSFGQWSSGTLLV